MATAQIFFDSNNERVIIRRPGQPDSLRHLRDEVAAARFAREMGYTLASAWRMLSHRAETGQWEHAQLRKTA